MKKRFNNILVRTREKNGILMLMCAVVLTISLGMLAGCSVTKENTTKQSAAPMPADNSSADNHTSKNTITLTFTKEGEQEQKQATLSTGNGYSFYLPDDERWYLSASDLSYPIDSEDGWGREFPVILDTFALSNGAYNGADNGKMYTTAGTGEYLNAEDCQMPMKKRLKMENAMLPWHSGTVTMKICFCI